MKALVLFYSYDGNTRRIAKLIAKKIGADMEEVQSVVPYSEILDETVEQGWKEVQSGYEPDIKSLSVALSDYDTIVLGTPVWHLHYAPVIKSLLSKYDWKGKKVYPYAANAGWLGRTLDDIKKGCVGADIQKGLNVEFDAHKLDKMKTSEKEILMWIEQIQLQ
jgi:flavodoxin